MHIWAGGIFALAQMGLSGKFKFLTTVFSQIKLFVSMSQNEGASQIDIIPKVLKKEPEPVTQSWNFKMHLTVTL